MRGKYVGSPVEQVDWAAFLRFGYAWRKAAGKANDHHTEFYVLVGQLTL